MLRKKNHKLTNLPQQAAQVPTTDAHETPETPGARDDDPTHSRIPHVLNLLMPSFTPPLMHLTPFSIFISTPLQHSAGEQNPWERPHPSRGGTVADFVFILFLPFDASSVLTCSINTALAVSCFSFLLGWRFCSFLDFSFSFEREPVLATE